MREKIKKRLKKDIAKSSILHMSKQIKVPYACLWRIINNEGDCRLKTWDKIEKFYS